MSNPNPNLIVQSTTTSYASDWNIFNNGANFSAIGIVGQNYNPNIPNYNTFSGIMYCNNSIVKSYTGWTFYSLLDNTYSQIPISLNLTCGMNKIIPTTQNYIYTFSYDLSQEISQRTNLTISINGIIIPSCTININDILPLTTYSTTFIATNNTKIEFLYWTNSIRGVSYQSTLFLQNLSLQNATLPQIFALKDYLQFNYIALHNAGYLDSDILSNATNSLSSGYVTSFMNGTWSLTDYIRNGATYSKLIAYNKPVNQTTLASITASTLVTYYNWSISDLINSGYSYTTLSSLFVINNNIISGLLTIGFTRSFLHSIGFNLLPLNSISLLIISGEKLSSINRSGTGYTIENNINSLVSLINIETSYTALLNSGFTVCMDNTADSLLLLIKAGANINKLTIAGFNYKSYLNGQLYRAADNIQTISTLITVGAMYNDLITSGFSIYNSLIAELINTGFTFTTLSTAGFIMLNDANIITILIYSGATYNKLFSAGFNVSNFKTLIDINTNTYFSVKNILINKWSLSDFIHAGYLYSELSSLFTIDTSNLSGVITIGDLMLNDSSITFSILNSIGFNISTTNMSSIIYYIISVLINIYGFNLTQIQSYPFVASSVTNNIIPAVSNNVGTIISLLKTTKLNYLISNKGFTLYMDNSVASLISLINAGATLQILFNKILLINKYVDDNSFTIASLVNASVTYTQLINAGFTINTTVIGQLIKLGVSIPLLVNVFPSTFFSNNNTIIASLINGGVKYSILSVAQTKFIFTVSNIITPTTSSGFTIFVALINAGALYSMLYSTEYINVTNNDIPTITNLINAKVTYTTLYSCGFIINQSTLTNFTASILAASPYNWSLSDLISSGYSSSSLTTLFPITSANLSTMLLTKNNTTNVSFTLSSLIALNWSISKLIISSGYTYSTLFSAGYTINPTTLANFTAATLKASPYNWSITDLINSGYLYDTLSHLFNFNSTDNNVNYCTIISNAIKSGTTYNNLISLRFTINTTILNSNFTAAILKASPYNWSLIDLIKSGYSYTTLISAGFTITPTILNGLGFTVTILAASPYNWSLIDLINSGYSYSSLFIGKFYITPSILLPNNFTAEILKSSPYNWSLNDLIFSGYSYITLSILFSITPSTLVSFSPNLLATQFNWSYDDLFSTGYSITILNSIPALQQRTKAGIVANILDVNGNLYIPINILIDNYDYSYSMLISVGYIITPTILNSYNFTATILAASPHNWSIIDLFNSGYSYTILSPIFYFNSTNDMVNSTVLTYIINNGIKYSTLINAGVNITLTILSNHGFTATSLKTLGWTLSELIIFGYSYTALLSAGFIITPTILNGLGFTAAILKASPYNWTLADLINSGYSYSTFISAGFTINQSTLTGINAVTLKTLGWTLVELVNSGYSSFTLINAGFSITPTILNNLGFTATSLKASPYNWSLADLINSGYSYSTFISAGFTINQSTLTGINAVTLKTLGWTLVELINSGYSSFTLSPIFNFTADNNSNYCSIIKSLINSGFSYTTLNNAKFLINVTILTGIGNSSTNANFTATSLKALGWSITDLNMNGTGYTLSQVIVAGFTYSQIISKYIVNTNTLISAGYGISVSGPQKLLTLKWTLSELKSCGFLFNDLINCIGVTAANLYSVGFTLNDFVKNGYSYSALTNAGLPVPIIYINLRNITASTFYNARWTAANLYSAQFPVSYFLNNLSLYPLSTLISAGYNSLFNFINSNYSYTLLIDAGFTINYTVLTGLGFTVNSLFSKGWTATDLINAGFSLSLLVNANLGSTFLTPVTSLSTLINQGFTYQQLANNQFQITKQILTSYSFTVASLKALGWSPLDLTRVGYTLTNLIPGYSYDELSTSLSSVTKQMLSSNSFNATSLKALGWSAFDLARAGYTLNDLINALFSYTQLSVAFVGNVTKSNLPEFTSAILKASPYNWSTDDLRSAGF
jgi:hypothetical protein